MNRKVLMLRAPTVLLLLWLVCGCLFPSRAGAQGSGTQSRGFRLEQNYPNPAHPDTYIPFVLEASLFEGGEPPVVSIRIINMFNHEIAVPKAVGHPRGPNVPVLNLRYTEPGRKVAYWDGRDMTGKRVPTATYYIVLQVGDQVEYARFSVSAPRRRSRLLPFFRRRGDD
ncbi:MAG TPA: hypothetical protein VFT45_22645 [Longimicrobium sp.]|nr:hypothetical protein [Longimicrobium sp.]